MNGPFENAGGEFVAECRPASRTSRAWGARGSRRHTLLSGMLRADMSVMMDSVCSSNVARGAGGDEEEMAASGWERAARRESRDALLREVKWTVDPGPTRVSMCRYWARYHSEDSSAWWIIISCEATNPCNSPSTDPVVIKESIQTSAMASTVCGVEEHWVSHSKRAHCGNTLGASGSSSSMCSMTYCGRERCDGSIARVRVRTRKEMVVKASQGMRALISKDCGRHA